MVRHPPWPESRLSLTFDPQLVLPLHRLLNLLRVLPAMAACEVAAVLVGTVSLKVLLGRLLGSSDDVCPPTLLGCSSALVSPL